MPPAPPGIILKVKHVNGDLKSPINVQKDAKIFGYDATTGQIVRFNLDLDTKTGVVDTKFTPITVPGTSPNNPPVAGLDLAWDGSMRVLLVSSGTTIYVYNPTTSAPPITSFTTKGSFMNGVNVNSIAGTDTLTVLGSYDTNELYAIDLPLSISKGIAEPASGNPITFNPQAQFTLLGGLTSCTGHEQRLCHHRGAP